MTPIRILAPFLLTSGLLLVLTACRSPETATQAEHADAADSERVESDRIAQDDEPPPPPYMAPTNVELPAESRPAPARSMRGVFTSANGIDLFRECGQTGSWVVTANDIVLQQLHARTAVMAEQLRQPAAPLYLEATGELLGATASGGPAQDVRNVVRLGSIARIEDSIPADCRVR